MAEWLKAAACKAVFVRIRWSESNPHQDLLSTPNIVLKKNLIRSMTFLQFKNILKMRLGDVPIGLSELNGIGSVSILSLDKLILRKKLTSGRYTYFILNSKALDSVRSCFFPPSHKNVLAYNYAISSLYDLYNSDGTRTSLEGTSLDGYVLTGLDLALDSNVQDISPKLGFSFSLFQRLLIGAYSSASKKVIMSLDAFTRYTLKNNATAKASQTVFYELFSVEENKFVVQAEVPVGELLLEIQKGSSLSTVPTDFFFGKESLKRSRVSSSSFSFDLDIYDKSAKEVNYGPYLGVTRFELRFRGCEHFSKQPQVLGFLRGKSGFPCEGVIEQNFLTFLDRAILLRQRPPKRISKTSFASLYKWPEDSWWSRVKSRLFDCDVVHLDAFLRLNREAALRKD